MRKFKLTILFMLFILTPLLIQYLTISPLKNFGLKNNLAEYFFSQDGKGYNKKMPSLPHEYKIFQEKVNEYWMSPISNDKWEYIYRAKITNYHRHRSEILIVEPIEDYDNLNSKNRINIESALKKALYYIGVSIDCEIVFSYDSSNKKLTKLYIRKITIPQENMQQNLLFILPIIYIFIIFSLVYFSYFHDVKMITKSEIFRILKDDEYIISTYRNNPVLLILIFAIWAITFSAFVLYLLFTFYIKPQNVLNWCAILFVPSLLTFLYLSSNYNSFVLLTNKRVLEIKNRISTLIIDIKNISSIENYPLTITSQKGEVITISPIEDEQIARKKIEDLIN